MPGPALNRSAAVLCLHGGQAQPTTPLPRVRLSGAQALGQATTFTITGCPFTLPGPAPSPCLTASWTVAAVRVRSSGVPLVLQDSTAVCVPNGTGLLVTFPGQVRVTAS
jgi:hypothetical protein